MSIGVLIDTNVVIKREDYEIIDDDLGNLIKILNDLNFQLLVHENSFMDIDNDKNIERKKIVQSKMNSYSILKSEFDFIQDGDFSNLMKFKGNSHDYVDNSLLYSVLKNEVSFLITEDKGIHKKLID